MRVVIVILGTALLSSLCNSATIYVPDHYAKIQDAIFASNGGDTIVVRPGIYVENIDFLGRAITLMSEKGPEITVIDGGNPSNPDIGSVVTFQRAETSKTQLIGFTITNGTGTGNSRRVGGGIYCYGAQPNIIDNIIRNNGVDSGGGGIYLRASELSIVNNLIQSNVAGTGGGIQCDSGRINTRIENNVIIRNSSGGAGGGLSINNCVKSVIIENRIIGNISRIRGAGIYCYKSDPDILFNKIIGNLATEQAMFGNGGGISLYWDCNPKIFNNLIDENYAGGVGGGIICENDCSPIVVNNIIINNNSGLFGGGVAVLCNYMALTPAVFINNTISKNNTAGAGGGVACLDSRVPTEIHNGVLWDNNAFAGFEIYVGGILSSSELTVSYSDVAGGQLAAWIQPGSTLNWGFGMIDMNPVFADPAKYDFHLTWPSPCCNTGDNTAVTELYDFEGAPRIALGTVDMGADEFYPHLYHGGDVKPGLLIDLKVVGDPGFPALLAFGTGIQDPPFPTPHGDLWLTMPLAKSWQLGPIPSTGILTMNATVPSGWPSGSVHPFQALVGPWGGQASLTNLMLLTTE